MHSSDTFHQTVIERVRGHLELPAVNSKIVDNYIIAHAALPCMVEVLSRLNNTSDNPIIHRYTISLVRDQEYYTIPPCVQSILRLAELDLAGNVVADYYPGSIMHPLGPGWYLEGNQLVIRPFPAAARDVSLWYINNGDVITHYAEDGQFESDTVFNLGTPTLGRLDRRRNAYAGSMLRVITDNVMKFKWVREGQETEPGGEMTLIGPIR